MEEQIVSMFMEVTSCESQAYAVQHLSSCRWNLDEAINLYFNTSSGGGGPSDMSAPIASGELVTKDDDDVYGDNGDDDVRAPIPTRVEAFCEDDDAYYGDRSAHDAPSIGEAPYPEPMPAFHVQALSEIEATGWGEAEPGDGGQVAAENVDGLQAQEDSRSSNSRQEDGGMDSSNDGEGGEDKDEEDNERYDHMSYSDNDNMGYSDNEVSDYGLEMDDEDAYYYSIAEDGTQADGDQPRSTQPEQQKNSLEEMYRLPLDLMYNASFHGAKVRAAREDRFLLVNLQTFGGGADFQSELHNRDLWADEQVKDVVKGSFVFLLLQKRKNYLHLDECTKVSSFYRLEEDELPAVLVLDPITGQLLDKRSGPMTPDEFMKCIDEYTKLKPSTLTKLEFVKKTATSAVAGGEEEPAASASAAAAVEQEPATPEISAPAAEAVKQEPENSAPGGEPVPVPETEPPAEMVDDDEPMEGEKMYKLRIRLPDGTIVAKEFGCKRRVALLFAFCRSAVRGGGEAEQKAFRIMRFAAGAFEAVQDGGGATFEDLRLNCSAVSVVFDT